MTPTPRNEADMLARGAVAQANREVGFERYVLTGEGASEFRLTTRAESGARIRTSVYQMPHELGKLLDEVKDGARLYLVKLPALRARLAKYPPKTR